MRFFLTTAALLLAVISAQAQVTARSALTTAPATVLASIDESTRLDMLDYYDSGIQRPSKTSFQSEATLTRLDNDVATLRIGDYQVIDFVVLQTKKGELIMVINRLFTPDAAADISFYNSRWEPLDTDKLLMLPTLSDWTGKIDAATRENIENALPFIMFDAEFIPESGVLTLTPQTSGYVSDENRKLVDNTLRTKIQYRWDTKSFRPIK